MADILTSGKIRPSIPGETVIDDLYVNDTHAGKQTFTRH